MIYAIGKCFCACVNENGKEKGERKFVSERKWVLNCGVFSQEKEKKKKNLGTATWNLHLLVWG